MIYTYTLAPAYDSFANASGFTTGHENLIRDKETFAGGKGINVSRALAAYGAHSEALILLGEDNCADYEEAIEQVPFSVLKIKMPGKIRENLTIEHDGTETRICTAEGITISEGILDRVLELEKPTAGDTVIISGRMPAGVSHEAELEFLKRIKNTGARLAVDSKSFTLRELGELGVWMVKPNREEIAAAIGGSFSDAKDVIARADEIRSFNIPNVIVSLDADGAVLITDKEIFTVRAPKLELVSSVGAGDSMVAGFVLGMEREDCGQALKLAAAFGSAACLAPGVYPPLKVNIDRMLAEIEK